MRLATFRNGGRDGTLALVSADLTRWSQPPNGICTLQSALDNWGAHEPDLRMSARRLDEGEEVGAKLDPSMLHAPLPRAYQWAEGSTYLSHMHRCRRARGVDLPDEVGSRPIVYQSGSDSFLAPTSPVVLADIDWGLDIEATVAVIVDDVPQGVSADEALGHIKLVVLVNDLTLRNLLPREFATGVGLYQSKPARAVAPVAVTPQSLGASWAGDRLNARVRCWINDELLGDLDAGADCSFGFGTLIAYMAETRSLSAGTMVGSGTVSNLAESHGVGCIIERRALQVLAGEDTLMPYLCPGNTLRIEAFDSQGLSLFGAIRQTVQSPK